jgi:hypothetical protein
MAIIVRDTMAKGRETCFSKLIGTPLKMRAAVGLFNGTRVWEYHGATLKCPGCGFPYDVVLEADLQAIDGPDATVKTSTPTTLPTAKPSRDLVTA